jgi:hypothetical protein
MKSKNVPLVEQYEEIYLAKKMKFEKIKQIKNE